MYSCNSLISYSDGNNDLNKLLIWCDYKLQNTTNLSKVKHIDLPEYINNSFWNLVIWDKWHNSNRITYRWFEWILCNTVNFIDIEYDLEKNYYQNELLREYCYVNSWEDIKNKIEKIKEQWLYETIIELQHKELERYKYLVK